VTPSVRLRAIGPLDVADIPTSALGSRKARSMLAALAVTGGEPVSADELVELLWGDNPPSRPGDQLSVLASRLRRVLGAERIVRAGGGYALRADWIDVSEFADRVREAEARLVGGSVMAARAAAAAALELVRGRLAADEDALWFDERRIAFDRTVARARAVAADAALAAGDATAAAACASALLDHDPYDEAALRTLMHAHVAAGRPASALGAYATVRARLAEDLGVDPSPATEELHTAILIGDQAAPASEAPVPATVVGRDAELEQLAIAFRRAEAGGAVALVVDGAAGIGKSALVNAFAATVASRALVLVGRCDELGRDLPLQPILDGLEDH
jgi:DNA-binding SARP family transcriptional activator